MSKILHQHKRLLHHDLILVNGNVIFYYNIIKLFKEQINYFEIYL
jgi:hypothetical protein